jgi:carboxyl-terminal processing protease
VQLPPASGGTASSTAVPTANSNRIDELYRSGPGFERISIRRGKNLGGVVGDVIAGSPADKAGIEPGWVLGSSSVNLDVASESVHFKGEFLRFSPEYARAYERNLTVEFPELKTTEQGKAALAAITANKVTIEYDFEVLPRIDLVDTRTLAGGATYLRFDSFVETALIDRVIGVIDSVGPQGLIVDLRHNHGGQSNEMRRVLGRLLGNDAYIGTVRAGRRFQNMRTEKKGPHYPGPIALLIGPATSSAAEIAAAAVLDNKRGILIGRMTNGSVLASNYFPLGGGWQAFIPMYDYVRSGDRRIEGVGVQPDIWVMPTLEDVRTGRDPVVDRALAELRR